MAEMIAVRLQFASVTFLKGGMFTDGCVRFHLPNASAVNAVQTSDWRVTQSFCAHGPRGTWVLSTCARRLGTTVCNGYLAMQLLNIGVQSPICWSSFHWDNSGVCPGDIFKETRTKYSCITKSEIQNAGLFLKDYY